MHEMMHLCIYMIQLFDMRTTEITKTHKDTFSTIMAFFNLSLVTCYSLPLSKLRHPLQSLTRKSTCQLLRIWEDMGELCEINDKIEGWITLGRALES